MMKYFVYILKSKKDCSFYIGYTTDLDRRLSEHNEGKSEYTARKVPWEIFYYEEYDNKTEALKRERFLKKQRNRNFYSKLNINK